MHSFLVTSTNPISCHDYALKLLCQNLDISPEKLPAHPDILILSSSSSISIKSIRELKHWVSQKPFQAKVKAALIEAAEKLTLPAQNALLKTLEEPPAHTIIILTSPNPHLLLPTIVSRCQVISVHPTKSDAEATPKLNTTPNPIDINVIPTLLNQLPTLSPGERLIRVGEYTTSRDKAIEFCSLLLDTLRHDLRPTKTSLYALKQTHQALKRLQANVNPKLTLEHLFLNL